MLKERNKTRKKVYELFIHHSQSVSVRDLTTGLVLTHWEVSEFLKRHNCKKWKDFFLIKSLELVPCDYGFKTFYEEMV